LNPTRRGLRPKTPKSQKGINKHNKKKLKTGEKKKWKTTKKGEGGNNSN